MPTPSEHAYLARAELEVIASALRLHELALLVELGRKLLDCGGSEVDAGRIPRHTFGEDR
jgi:hypothetical protein